MGLKSFHVSHLFRPNKPFLVDWYLKTEVYTLETSSMEGLWKKQLCSQKLLEFATAFWVQNLWGALRNGPWSIVESNAQSYWWFMVTWQQLYLNATRQATILQNYCLLQVNKWKINIHTFELQKNWWRYDWLSQLWNVKLNWKNSDLPVTALPLTGGYFDFFLPYYTKFQL